MFKYYLLFVVGASITISVDSCARLTETQVGLIRQTWDIARRDAHVAPKVFLRLFKEHPEYQKLFAKFANVPLSDLSTNGDFLAQAYTVLAGLNQVVESSGDLLTEQLHHLGVTHEPRGVKPWHFDAFASALVATLKEELGSALTPQAEDAWIDALNGMNKVVSGSLKPAGEVPHVQTHLTPNQVKAVQGLWAKVRGDRQQIGEETFVQLFKEHPNYLKLFPKFANSGNVAGDAEFKKQVTAVVDRLDQVISTLDNDLVLVGELIYLGHTHFPRHVTREHFVNFEEDFVQVLGKHGASAAEQAAVTEVLTTLVGQIVDNLN